MSTPNTTRPLLPRLELPAATPLDDLFQDGPAPKRQCISNACMPCRGRKSKVGENGLKCDGAKPSCNTCISVYVTDCYYDPDSDNRRKGALRKVIRELEAEKAEQSIILDAIRQGSEADADDVVHLIRTNPDKPYESIAESVKKLSLFSSVNSEIPSLEGVLAGFGKPSFDNDGETRHYGYTSNLAVFGLEEEESFAVVMDEVETWTRITQNKDFIKHLLLLYFSWTHPLYLLFSEEVFWHALENKKLRYCSPMLVNAMLAVACNFSDRPEARTDPDDSTTVGDQFFAEAKRLLAEDDRSCLTTVQALGVMATRQAMNNHHSSGWGLVGRMMNMSVELGLHTTYSGPVNKKITPTEVEVRRITFWGCYALETCWSICSGRVSSLPRTAIRLEKPYLRENLESKMWKPYFDPLFPQYFPNAQHLAILEQSAFTYTLLVHLSRLSEIVNDNIQMFYAPRDRITNRKLQLQLKKFQQWYKNLPMEMTIKEVGQTLPQVIALHIYYHDCVNHLFRPFVQVPFQDGTEAPRQICSEAAITISHLVMRYKMTYGLRRPYFVLTHCTMSAAIIHLFNMSPQNPNPIMTIQASNYLCEAIQMLHEMHTIFPIVARYLKVIRNLTSKWGPRLPNNVKHALDAFDLSSPNQSESSVERDSLAGVQTTMSYKSRELPTPPTFEDRKHSAADLPILSSLTGESGIFTPDLKQLLWIPNLEGMEGRLVDQTNTNLDPNMNINILIDADANSNRGQLDRDGYQMNLADISPLWDHQWVAEFVDHTKDSQEYRNFQGG